MTNAMTSPKEYLDLVYELWEGSWADDAVKRDRESGVFTDPARVRKVIRKSEHFRTDGIHLAEPSPRRTPVLYQAGASGAGGPSPRGMRNASSSAGPPPVRSRPSWPIPAPRQRPRSATRPR